MEDAFLEADDLIWDSVVSSLSGSLFVVVKLELIALEDSKERFVVDSCLLVSPEMFYKLVYFSLINTKFHVLKDVFEIISRKRTTALFVKKFKCLGQALDSCPS